MIWTNTNPGTNGMVTAIPTPEIVAIPEEIYVAGVNDSLPVPKILKSAVSSFGFAPKTSADPESMEMVPLPGYAGIYI